MRTLIKMNKILIVDDEPGVRESLKFSLKDMYTLDFASTGREAIEKVEKNTPDLVILDIILPDKDGIDVLKEIKSIDGNIPVIMLTAVSRVKIAVEAMKAGAVDYLTKPFDIEELIIVIKNVFNAEKLKGQISILRKEIGREYPIDNIIFRSSKMKKVLNLTDKVIETDSPVLITGPTGVGKELIARYIHEKSKRKNEPFIPIHCAAIPESLFESELFGYEKGAFTDAARGKKGKIEIAGNGTIFFDEVGEIPLSFQIKLLRFLQDKKFSPLGSNEVKESDARLIFATSKNLLTEIEKGKFREDLYYRINIIPIYIPPLKERKEDISPLINFYFSIYKKIINSKTNSFSPEALKLLQNYNWPGNVREIKNFIERILVLKGNKVIINIEDLPEEIKGYKTEDVPYKEKITRYEKELIINALEKAGWNQTKAAKILKTTRRILKYRMEKLGIKKRENE